MSGDVRPIVTSVATSVSGYDGHLSAEIDSRPWGFNGGRSQYFEGDSCYVLVYRSANVDIISSYCSNPSVTFGKVKKVPEGTGYNYVREGLTFMSPIAHASKPIPKGYRVLNQLLVGCSGIEVKTGYTLVRATKWLSPADPSKAPPYAYVFIEYEPISDLYCFSNLTVDAKMLTTQVHGVIFGKAIAS